MLTIIVFKASNGMPGWYYAPAAALADPRIGRVFRYPDTEGFPTVLDAFNAIQRDKTIPKNTPVEVEGAQARDMAGLGLPFLAAAKAAFDELEAECNAPRGHGSES